MFINWRKEAKSWRRPFGGAVHLYWAIPLACFVGCIPILPPPPAPLFQLPLSINGSTVDEAIVDTGGGYELMLRENIGLPIVDEVEVLAFGGKETVGFAQGFDYSVGDISLTAQAALVGVSICDCNGLGYLFLRRTGRTLAIDFGTNAASLLDSVPPGEITIPFESPPLSLPNFDSAFLTVDVTAGGETIRLKGLLDTGTNSTIMRRGLVDAPDRVLPTDRIDVTIGRSELGVVAANVGLFDTEGLPDIVLGTDVMRAWGQKWYFSYKPRGGLVVVIPKAADFPGDISPAS